MEKKKFNMRSLTSMTVALGFLFMSVSGIVLYLSPKGRVANWTGWSMMGMDKETWGGLHTSIGLLLLLGGALHIYFNWRPLVQYLKKPFAEGVRRSRKEAVASVALVTAVFFGTLFSVPPFSAVASVGESIKSYWEISSTKTPYAHAEDDTLLVFAEKLGRPTDELLERLASKGYETDNLELKVAELAEQYDVTPATLFGALSSGFGQGVRGQGEGNPGPGYAYGAFGSPGGGFGRKTLEQACAESGVNLAEAIAKLTEKGVTATGPENVRDLAAQAGMNSGDLATFIGAGEVH